MSCPAHIALERDWSALERTVASGRWPDVRLETTTDDLVRFVHAYATYDEKTFWHCFRFGFESYPGSPPSVQCVHPLTKEMPRPNVVPWWPQASGNPHVNLQPSSDLPYFCFPYTLEYMRTHNPANEERHRWAVGKHTLSATITELRRVLRPPHYKGYFDGEFKEKLRAQLAEKPSPFSPW